MIAQGLDDLTAGGGPALLALVAVLLLPLPTILRDLFGRRRADRGAYLLNRGGNGLGATAAGAVAGNVGIGSFLGIFLFTQEAPAIGASLAAAYTLGLVLTAALAGVIRARAGRLGSVGLADFVALAHGAPRLAILAPLATVFVLRAALQLAALGLLAQGAFGGSAAVATLVAAGVVAVYLAAGGYRAAVSTDKMQAAILLGGTALLLVGLVQGGMGGDAAPEGWTLGSHGAALMVAVWLLLPSSAVLAVDNWQRVTLAASTRVAVWGYLGAAAACGLVYASAVILARQAPAGLGLADAALGAMPGGWDWVVAAMFAACILSSVDTFVMPIVAGLGPNVPLARLRLAAVGLVGAAAAVAVLGGGPLPTLVAAFSGLTVFLPAALGSLLLRDPPARAAIWSCGAGLVVALAAIPVMPDHAGLAGSAVAAIAYVAGHRLGGAARPSPSRPHSFE